MKNIIRAIFLLAVSIAVPASAIAQNSSQRISASDMYLISAKAGGVNFVEGTVTIMRVDGTSGHLIKGDQIEVGDRVSTGANGRAEVLLNPGSYVRLGSNSSLKFNTTSLDDLQISLISGSAMFEVYASDKFRVNLSTPKERITMFDTGIYRVDLQQNGSGTFAVVSGKGVVGRIASLTLVKSGQQATFGSGPVVVSKSDRATADELAVWSKSRAKDLAKMTSSLKNANVGNSLMSSFNRGTWNMFGSFGLWVRDPFSGMFCFLPFGPGWNSPYGYGYRNGLYWYNPQYIPPSFIPPVNPPGNPPQGDLDHRKPIDDATPPFIALEKQQKNMGEGRRPPAFDGGGRSITGDSGRYSPPSEQRFPSESSTPVRTFTPPASTPPSSTPSGSFMPPPTKRDKPTDN